MNNNPVTLEGEIQDIDFQNRFFFLQTKEGLKKVWWTAQHEKYMQKQKRGYYQNFPAIAKDETEYTVIDIRYAQRPPEWQRKNKAPAQRNDALIVLQACYKESCETIRQADITGQDSATLAELHQAAVQQAITDARALIAAAKEMQA